MTQLQDDQLLAQLFRAFHGVLPMDLPPHHLELHRSYMAGAMALRELLKRAAAVSPAELQAIRQLVDAELHVWEATLGTCLEGKV